MPEWDEPVTVDQVVEAYERSTGEVPDTRDFVAIQDLVKEYNAGETGS